MFASPMEVGSVMQAIIDRIEARVYYVPALDLFHTIDFCASPTMDDLVAVPRLKGPGMAVEPFCGQFFIGVARVLNFYSLTQSDQRAPTILHVYPD
jgi:hypothetical protein